MEILYLLGFRLLNKYSLVHHVGPLYYWLTKRGRRKFWEPKLWGSLGKPKHWKKISINFTQIFRICPKMFQFWKYLLHKQIIEMCHSQNLRRPLSVPCPTQWIPPRLLKNIKHSVHCFALLRFGKYCLHIFWRYPSQVFMNFVETTV